MIDVVEILQHWHAERPKSVIADSLWVDVKTVRKYVAPAEAAGMKPGGPPLSRARWAELVRGWFPELVDAKARSATFGLIEPFRDRIATMLVTNTVTTVHQRLRNEDGLTVGLTSFRRYCWSEFPERTAADRVTVPRPPVAPGEEAQIDYGFAGSWRDPVDGRVRRVWVFVMVLACSRHMFVRPVLSHQRQCVGSRARRRVHLLWRRPATAGDRQPARPGWTALTCMTRSSTGPMPSWPSTMAR